MNANEKTLDRYERQVRLIGRAGQKRLGGARVFLAGAGGLGSAVSIYLTAAGIGFLRIADRGRVELSNLNRQVLFGDADIGRLKVEAAKRRLKRLGPDLRLDIRPVEITGDNIDGLIEDCDVAVDALDNFDTRYILNEGCLRKGIPLVHGAVNGFYGQATTIVPGRTVCLKCIFPEAPPPRPVPIIGSLCGFIGSIEATETLKYLLKMGNLLENKLLMVDGLNIELSEINLERDRSCRTCGSGWRRA